VQTLREVSTEIASLVPPERSGTTENGARFDRIFEVNMGILRLKFTMNYLMNLTHHFEIVGALLFGGWCVLSRTTEIGTVVAFISAGGRLNDPWSDLVNYFRDATSTQMKYRLVVDAADALAQRREPSSLELL
jgi:ABC-type bacteriocin/lantibiotic exporter with double-glycine peptidase domain